MITTNVLEVITTGENGVLIIYENLWKQIFTNMQTTKYGYRKQLCGVKCSWCK